MNIKCYFLISGTKSTRRRKNSENDNITNKIRSNFCNTKEDLENKQGRKKNGIRSYTKKKVLEETNNTKLRDVKVCVENCLQNTSNSTEIPAVCKRFEEESASSKEDCVSDSPRTPLTENDRTECENDENLNKDSVSENTVPEEICDEKKNESVSEPVPEPAEIVKEVEKSSEVVNCEVVGQRTLDKSEVLEGTSRGDDDGPLSSSSPFSRMELAESSNASLLRFPDDRSDSGVSSLRSGSGDERSGSRSSALSSSDEPQQHTTPNSQSTRSPLFIPANQTFNTPTSSATEPVRVWRDPSLLLESEPHVRHIHSVQHQSLLMSHPSTPAASGPPPTSAASHPTSLYPPVPPPPNLMSPHPLHNHPHLPPPGLYPHHLPEMLWKQRYSLPVNAHLLAPQAAHPSTEEIMERERAYAQGQERFIR